MHKINQEIMQARLGFLSSKSPLIDLCHAAAISS